MLYTKNCFPLLLGVLLFIVAACDKKLPEPDPIIKGKYPTSKLLLEKISGDNQKGWADIALTDPLKVRLVDSNQVQCFYVIDPT